MVVVVVEGLHLVAAAGIVSLYAECQFLCSLFCVASQCIWKVHPCSDADFAVHVSCEDCLEPVCLCLLVPGEIVGEECHRDVDVIEFLLWERGHPFLYGVVEKECPGARAAEINHVETRPGELAGSGPCIGDESRHEIALVIVQHSVDRALYMASEGPGKCPGAAGPVGLLFSGGIERIAWLSGIREGSCHRGHDGNCRKHCPVYVSVFSQ